MSKYVLNKETQKLELHFDKSDYMALSDDLKKEIKSNFLFSRAANAWVSRAKFPNLWRAEAVAKKIGLADGGKIGETLSFSEQMERKAERAEARAERYDMKSDLAAEKGKTLQKPINDMRGDTAFFTQPNINTSSGRAFTNRRKRMFAAFEKGFDEFKKSEYYAERAEIARQTASGTKPTDKGFIDRRIKEAEKTIKAQEQNLKKYNEYLKKIEDGQVLKNYAGETITAETIQNWIEKTEMILDNAISKSIYYHECLEEIGGVVYSQDNIKTGYIINLSRWGKCKVLGTGKVNISYEIMEGGAAGLGGKAAYAEIKSIISQEIHIDPHPFNVGDTYTVSVWDSNEGKIVNKEYTVTKVTEEKVTLKSGIDRAITRKPRKVPIQSTKDRICWALGIVDGFNGTVYKNAPVSN